MLARTIICLLALACILAGAEAVETGNNAPELAYGKLIRTLDPGKKYEIFVVEITP